MMNVYTYPCTHTHHFNGHFSRWTTINWLSPWFSFSIYSWSNKCHAQIAQTPLIRFGVDLLYNTLYNKSTANPQHAWQIYNKSTTSAQLVVQQIHNKSYKCSLGYRRRVTDHILLSCGKTVRQCSVQHNTVWHGCHQHFPIVATLKQKLAHTVHTFMKYYIHWIWIRMSVILWEFCNSILLLLVSWTSEH